MKPELENKPLLEFSTPPDNTQPIEVSITLPDGSKEIIGCITRDFGNGEYPAIYFSVNTIGDEIFPPTEDYSEVETRFERYAKGFQASPVKELKKETDIHRNNARELKSVRQAKGRTTKSLIVTNINL